MSQYQPPGQPVPPPDSGSPTPQHGYTSPPQQAAGPVSGVPTSPAPDGQQFPPAGIGAATPPPAMPPGPGMPPPVNLTATSTAVKRPAVAYIAAALLAIIGLQFVTIGFLDATELLYYTYSVGWSDDAVIMSAIYKAIMFFMALLAAVLTIVGLDFGRILGAGIAGAAMWLAAGAWIDLMLPVIDGNVSGYPDEVYFSLVIPILAGFFGIAALGVLAAPSFSQWSADRRKAKR